MSKKDEALRLALEGIEAEMNPAWDCSSYHPKLYQSITAIHEALAEQPAQQQEPVAEVESDGVLRFKKIDRRYQVGDKLYLSPPQRKPWVSLTDEEENEYNHLGPDMRWVIQEVEAKLKEKNA